MLVWFEITNIDGYKYSVDGHNHSKETFYHLSGCDFHTYDCSVEFIGKKIGKYNKILKLGRKIKKAGF